MIREEDKLRFKDIKTDDKDDKMLKLSEILESIEKDRLDGKMGCTIEELDAYLEEVIEES